MSSSQMQTEEIMDYRDDIAQVDTGPAPINTSNNKMLHDNYLCSVNYNKQQIEQQRSRNVTGKLGKPSTPKRVWIRSMHGASVAVSGQEDEDEASSNQTSSMIFSAPANIRKLRTYSYRRAVTTPPKIVVTGGMPGVKEQNETEIDCSDEPHYQRIVAEKGLLNDTVEEEGDADVKRSKTFNHRQAVLGHCWTSQSRLQSSVCFGNISTRERKRQEAMFELITSESSYLRSLNLLVNFFMKSQELRSSMTSTEYHHLFSNVEAVRSTSRRFFNALERRRKSSSLVIDDVCDIVSDYVTSGLFEPYITYCSNESFQQKVYQTLMSENSTFTQVLRQLESRDESTLLPMHSFLLLPMQRITRLPLLVDSIRQRCDVTMPQYRSASSALRETTQLVRICNERAKSLERTERMVQLQQQLEFKSARSFALISSTRYLLKRGSIFKVAAEAVLGFRRLSRQEIYLFLFNDVLLIAKKRNNDTYSVTDYCYKNRLRARDIINDICSFILVMEKNQDGEEVEVRLEADKPNTKARWMTAMKSNNSYVPKITKSNMQVEIIRSLLTDEPDMMSLKIMDVYLVLNTTPDGWIYGERLSDGCRAWFPSTHTKEILSEKVRERNLQRRNRLLGEQTLI